MKKAAGKKKVTVKASKKPSILDRLPKNEGEHIQLMIDMTVKRIKSPTTSDRWMVDQVSRLEARLTEWKRANSK